MTPAAFHSAYRGAADQVSAGTGIDPIALLAQWARETAWGEVVIGNNLGNIRCSPTTFCQYATLEEFITACIATWHNGFYNNVLAANDAVSQLAAMCVSPWSSDHYGGSLDSTYQPLEEFELTPDEHNWLKAVYDQVRGPDPYGNVDQIMGRTGTYAASLPNILKAVEAVPGGGGGTPEPPEPTEPTSATLHVPAQDIPISFP